jgi:hypothetical protein
MENCRQRCIKEITGRQALRIMTGKQVDRSVSQQEKRRLRQVGTMLKIL